MAKNSFLGLTTLLLAYITLNAASHRVVFAQSSPSLHKVVLAVPSPTLAFVQFYIGKAYGLYQQEGIELEIVRMKTDLVSPGLISGQVQYGVPLSNFVRAAAAGLAVKLVMSFQTKIGAYDFVVPNDVKSFEQLKGQMIGITARSGNLHLTAAAVLKAHGLSEGDVTFVSYADIRDATQALETGYIKGGIFPPPVNIFLSMKGFRTLARGDDYYDGALQGLATSERYIRERRAAVVAMIRATLRSLRFIEENPREAEGFIEKHQRVSSELAKKLYRILVDMSSRDGEISERWMQERLDEMEKFGLKAKIRDAGKILDLGPLREARASLKW